MRREVLPSGRFQYESGSYGGPGGYFPSIVCYKETESGAWSRHFCLVKPDAIIGDAVTAASLADQHLAAARSIVDEGGSPQDFALSLRHEGYKNVPDFKVVSE